MSQLQSQLAVIEEFLSRLGADPVKERVNVHLGGDSGPGVTFWGPTKWRAQLEALGKPERDKSSMLGVARWKPDESRPFTVTAYYWFLDKACAECGR